MHLMEPFQVLPNFSLQLGLSSHQFGNRTERVILDSLLIVGMGNLVVVILAGVVDVEVVGAESSVVSSIYISSIGKVGTMVHIEWVGVLWL